MSERLRVALRLDEPLRAGLLPTRRILAHGTEEPMEFLSRFRYLAYYADVMADRP